MAPTRAVVNHIGQCVSDIERSRRFYIEALGFTPWFEIEPPDDLTAPLLGVEPPLGTKTAYLRAGDVVLELLAFPDADVAARTRIVTELGLTHLSLAVDDVDATIERVVEHGGSTHTTTRAGSFVRDPDGQLLELLPAAYRTRLPPVPDA